MTATELCDWLAGREPAPPAALAQRLCELARDTKATRIHEALGELALAVLASLDGRDERTVALDLLAADALVTYAFEAAAESGSDLSAVADSILARLEA